MKKLSVYFFVLLTCTAVLSGCSTFLTSSGRSDLAMVSASGGLTLRAKQSQKAEKIDTIAFGETVEVISAGQPDTIDSIKDKWYKVTFNGETGYLFGGYLNLYNFSEADLPHEIIKSWFTHDDPPYWEFAIRSNHTILMKSQKYSSKSVTESTGRYLFNRKALIKIIWSNNDVDYLLITKTEKGAMTLYAPKTKFTFDPSLRK